ncbi:Cytochrome P450 monooxygenase COX1 [Psilocybe cubensis]|uniref:Cytochrome P450 monooxygenase COX1 n=1 Tax=Psilocybe cubensis TaxID=181762 RepID=A0ACB8GKC9_PSICU|nr:Cytochrome P450 monooxygenase COX1 [Psilocybe cubensis]KAH9476136.1 Cytochrome P450 monooxygenase COX1 [Psilocybe cubensis]
MYHGTWGTAGLTWLCAAVGHVSSEDDEYDGYFIPRGTVVLGNAWTILHDPEEFKDPLEFNPDRYLKDGKLDPNIAQPLALDDERLHITTNSICPGRHMSDNGLYCIISSVLSVFEIKPFIDDGGNPVIPKPEFTSGMLS